MINYGIDTINVQPIDRSFNEVISIIYDNLVDNFKLIIVGFYEVLVFNFNNNFSNMDIYIKDILKLFKIEALINVLMTIIKEI